MLRKVMVLLFLAPLLAFVVPALTPGRGSALPLFARKYGMPCTSCHVAFPRLNAFGMQFRQNGYRIQGTPGQSPWEAKEYPLSLVGNVGYDYTRADTADVVTGVRGSSSTSAFKQNAVEFHTAGTLAPKVTFHFDNGFADNTGVLTTGMAFVQFDDLAKDGALNLKAGIYDAEIPYLASSRNTARPDYLSPVTLDAGGIELNGTKSGWTYAAGLINSARDPLNAKPGSSTFNQFENVYAWLMRDIHDQLVTARVYLNQQDPRTPSASTSRHLQADVSAYLNSGHWILIPGYTYQKFDDQADGVPSPGSTERHQTALLEGLALFGKDSQWVLTARWELEHIEKLRDQQLEVADLGYYVNPNAKIALDWTHAVDNVGGPRVDEVQLYVFVGY